MRETRIGTMNHPPTQALTECPERAQDISQGSSTSNARATTPGKSRWHPAANCEAARSANPICGRIQNPIRLTRKENRSGQNAARFITRFCAILALFFCLHAFADEVIPPAPQQYFNDYAGVVSPNVASELNTTLENFERQSSDQILVAIFPKMQSDSSIEDYGVRVARAWKVGQQNKNNGAVLFIFTQDHRMFIQVGYGLEGVLPDALCKRIIDEQISPRFHSGDFDGGCTAGVQAMLAAVKGEYKGNGMTVAQSRYQSDGNTLGVIFTIIFLVIFLLVFIGGLAQSRSGFGGGFIFTSGGWGGGGWGGGGGGGFSGGGFSGGGGSFGGGGAGGSW